MTQADNNATIKPQATSHSQNSALVSIIIPAYNTAPYIHRAIGSSIRQTHKNIEILIIDDGSTDDTLRVAEYFAGTDSRIRVFTQKNAGVSAARNHGIDKARGEYIYFLDSDDWLEDDAIETLLDAQREHPDCLICGNYWWGVEFEGSNLLRPFEGEKIHSRFIDMKDVAEGYARLQGSIIKFHNASAKLFRTPFSARFPGEIKLGEDAVFFLRYFLKSNGAYYLSKPVLNVLDRNGSATRSLYRPEYTDSLVKGHKAILDAVKDIEEIRAMMLMSWNIYIYTEALMKAIRANVDRSEIRRVRKFIRPYAHYTLKCRRYSLKMRARFFIAVYAPVPVCRAVRFVWKFLKSLRGKKSPDMQIIPNWQDFPKAPEI